MLDELRLLVVVDNETDTLSSIGEGIPQTPEVVQQLPRIAATRTHAGHPCKVVFDRLCCAGHGFSVLVTGRRGDRQRTMLFDVGPYADLWLANAARLGIDLATIELVFLSHWHSDHSGALAHVVAAVAEARRKAGVDAPVLVDLHPDRPDQRGILLPNGTMIMLAPEPTFEAVESAGGRVVKSAKGHPLCDSFFFGSGQIDRLTEYETGLVGHHSFRGEAGRHGRPSHPRRALRGRSGARSGCHAALGVLTRGRRERRARGAGRLRGSGRSAARRLSPERQGDGGTHRKDGPRSARAHPTTHRGTRPLHGLASQGGAGSRVRAGSLWAERRRSGLHAPRARVIG